MMVANMQSPSAFRWDDARVLLALLEAGTLSGAGVKLGINTSTVSRRLEALEEALGARLFDRTPDGVLPTALAEALAPHAEALELSASGFAMAAEGREREVAGLVRITAPPGVAEHLLAPALPRLFARWPKLRVALDATIAYADLSRREADLALRVQRPTQGDLVAKKLSEEEDALLASASYARELGRLTRADQARWITWGDELAHIPPARWVAAVAPLESVVLRTSSIGSQLAAAEAGVGVVLLARPYRERVGLVEVKLAPSLAGSLPPKPRGALWLVGHRALREVPRIAAVWTFLEEEAARVLR
jgi:DNA-binding transcriptional LysR family regulator